MLSRTQHLHALLGEVGVKTRQREPGAIDGWLANLPMEPNPRPFELHLQLLGVRIVKAFDCNNRNAFPLIAWRRDRLGPALFRHED